MRVSLGRKPKFSGQLLYFSDTLLTQAVAGRSGKYLCNLKVVARVTPLRATPQLHSLLWFCCV